MARSSEPPKPAKAYLTCSKQEAESKLAARLEMGRRLRAMVPLIGDHLKEANTECEIWDSYNAQLLKGLFTTIEESEKYAWAPPIGVSLTLQTYYIDVDRSLKHLRDVIGRLSLFDEDPTLLRQAHKVGTGGVKIFIGHGHSAEWLKLKNFIQDRLHLIPDKFDMESAAGIATTERLAEMLDDARFAFLVLTGEDEQAVGKLQARQNVIHELGLFQGRLGWKKAIVLLESECDEFSNIAGLGQIRFPKGDIGAAFEQIRAVLEREKIQ
jgi:Predicted nucleotide-binding protein containing TIR-like domain